MEVTRREMLTTASALGAVAALNGANAEAGTTADATRAWNVSPDDLLANHRARAARIVEASDPDLFGGIQETDFTRWASTATPPHKTRGLYKNGDTTDVRNLKAVYAFLYKLDSGEHQHFQILAMGALPNGQSLNVLAQDMFDKMHADIVSHYFAVGQTSATFEPIPSHFFRYNGLLRRVLLYMARIQATDPRLTFTKSGAAWNLTLCKRTC